MSRPPLPTSSPHSSGNANARRLLWCLMVALAVGTGYLVPVLSVAMDRAEKSLQFATRGLDASRRLATLLDDRGIEESLVRRQLSDCVAELHQSTKGLRTQVDLPRAALLQPAGLAASLLELERQWGKIQPPLEDALKPAGRRLHDRSLRMSEVPAFSKRWLEVETLAITERRVLQSWIFYLTVGGCGLGLIVLILAALLLDAGGAQGSDSIQTAAQSAKAEPPRRSFSPNGQGFPGKVADLPTPARYRASVDEIRQLYQEVLGNLAEAVVLVAEDGQVVEVNRAAATLLGCTPEEALRKPLGQLLRRHGGVPRERQIEYFLSSGNWKLHGSELEAELVRQDGSVFPAEVRLSECPTSQGRFFLVSLSDASEDRRKDLLSRERLRVIEMISRNQPLEIVLGSLAEMIEHQISQSYCAIMLVQRDHLYPSVAPNLPLAFVESLKGLPIGPEGSSCSVAVFERRAVNAANLASGPLPEHFKKAAAAHDLRASWSAPIFSSEGLVVGTLAVYRREAGAPNGAQSELLEMASRLASVCIEQRQLTGQLVHRAQHDNLTGLPNRPAFEDWLNRAIAQARRYRRSLAVLSIDLDRFKIVNDTLGHAVGDGLLQQVARRLESCMRETDVVTRWGGDEFAVGVLELQSSEDAVVTARRLMEVLSSPFLIEGHTLSVRATIGISVFPDDGETIEALLRNADRAMYRGKANGRNSFQCCTPELRLVERDRIDMENQLGGALERGELSVHYQPQYDLKSGGLAGMEALLRWRHPRLGLVPPSSFIPIAEDSGLIVPIGSWILQAACRQVRALQDSGRPACRVAVNVSSLQFARVGFLELVASCLKEAGIEARWLELELTESLVMRDIEESAPRLAKLRDLGVRISIDDFGTGHSSLSYLQRLPIDNLKIDQSFVQALGSSPRASSIVKSIVTLAQNLGMTATAEGVESVSQLSLLRPAHCDLVQGYLLGIPVPAEELFPLPGLATAGRPGFLITIPETQDVLTRPTGCQALPHSSRQGVSRPRPNLRIA